MTKALLLLAAVFAAGRAYAFPEMVRHGYLNCNSCHTTMVGGGLLNEYGRALSREILSQQSLAGIPVTEGDEKTAYGLIKQPSWLLLGSDVRLLQMFSESKEASKGRFMIMQLDVDASAQISDRFRVFASVGRIEPRDADSTARDFVSSPRHGIEYAFSKPEAVNRVTARAGRFMPAYGIGFAEHPFVTRRLLDFQPGQERTAFELAWANDQSSVIATGIVAQSNQNLIKSEKGGVIQAATAVGERSKVGVNYYQTQKDDGKGPYTRKIMGAFANVGFTKQWYGLLEVDRPQGGDRKWGLIEIFKLGYEISQGVNLLAVQEYANLNVENSNPKFDAYSAGVEWFPRPHWDMYALYRRERDTALSANFADVVWLIAHFYL